MTLYERLKEERQNAGFSQKEFAEILGLNQRTYASYERGERDISTSVLLNICMALHISSDKLIGNTFSNEEIQHSSDHTRWERAMEQYADMSPDEQKRIDALLDAFFPDETTHQTGIIKETTVGAEQDRRAATDDEAEETA